MGKRILVINDTQEILDLFRILLEGEGYEVILSGAPILKLSEIEEIQPDLVLLDVLFRDEKTGWQMLEILRTNRATASIPVVICSAAIKDVQEQEGYLNSKRVLIVYKPFDIDDLLKTVQKALDIASQDKTL